MQAGMCGVTTEDRIKNDHIKQKKRKKKKSIIMFEMLWAHTWKIR